MVWSYGEKIEKRQIRGKIAKDNICLLIAGHLYDWLGWVSLSCSILINKIKLFHPVDLFYFLSKFASFFFSSFLSSLLTLIAFFIIIPSCNVTSLLMSKSCREYFPNNK